MIKDIVYQINQVTDTKQIIDLFIKSGMPRPTDDPQRVQEMFDNSDLIITAHYNNTLVGVCRCITDWVWCCYLSDLAVDPDYKKIGIGTHLIQLTREKLGQQVMILLLSVPTAMSYYPKVGFTKAERVFIMNRTK